MTYFSERLGGYRRLLAIVAVSIRWASCFPTQCPPIRSAVLHSSLHKNHDNETHRLPRQSRRQTMQHVASLASILITGTVGATVAHAYQNEFPADLNTVTDGVLDSKQRKLQQVRRQRGEFARTSSIALGPLAQPLASLLWGGALWLLAGSRSNPLVKPLANVLYDGKKEEWLQDRNDGLFSDIPAPLLFLLALLFCGLGYGADQAATVLADGERNTSLQLAGVLLISGAALEVGRLASGEKMVTREENDRDVQLEDEFATFAEQRLRVGSGNCHRLEVVASFRRFYAKYRVESEEFPLSDLEIEQLLRNWSRQRRRKVEMTSAGFYKGLQINADADLLAARR